MSGPVHPDGKFKRITEYNEAELQNAIDEAMAHCKLNGLDFYAILRGVDAYMERRRRKWGK